MDAVVAKPRRRRRWPYLVLILLLGFAAYTAFVLTWSYSDGERVGILQKVSRKGFVCKTHEGELALYVVAGVAPQIWAFTVRDPQVARQVDRQLGERVRLHYTEHKGVPTSCFGDTPYYVDSIVQIGPSLGAPIAVPAVPVTGASAAAAPAAPGSAAPANPPAPNK